MVAGLAGDRVGDRERPFMGKINMCVRRTNYHLIGNHRPGFVVVILWIVSGTFQVIDVSLVVLLGKQPVLR